MPEVSALRTALLDFFRSSRRELPWRSDVDPYRVLVSEFMLQQTRVETVIPYFLRWMERFPTLRSLAEADSEEVLRHWQGLGYYSRARRLQEVVREVHARYGGAIPSDPELLATMPGIGPYTAGAVASIAFGVPVGAVDGNVRRVLSRLLDEPRPSARRLEQVASTLVDSDRPGEFNQAMMELGSLVCTPRGPMCDQCPLRPFCQARAAGTWLERPERVSRRPLRERTEVVAILVGQGANSPADAGRGEARRSLPRDAHWRALLRRRPARGLLAGLWEFPGLEVTEDTGAMEVTEGTEAGEATGGGESVDPRVQVRELTAALLDEAGISGMAEAVRLGGEAAPVALSPLEHLFSHLRVRYLPYLVRLSVPQVRGGVPQAWPTPAGAYRWTSPLEAVDVPLPAAQRKLWKAVEAEINRAGAPVPEEPRQEE